MKSTVVALFLAVSLMAHTVSAQSTTFALDLRFSADSANLFSFPVNNPAATTQIGPVGSSAALGYATFAMDFNTAGTTLHVIDNLVSNSFQMGTVDTTTGAFSAGPAISGPLAGQSNTGLSVDPTDETFFVSSSTSLFTINPNTGVSASIGNFSGSTPAGDPIGIVIDIAVDNSGQMYAHDISTDSLWAIDKSSAAATFIGGSGLAANFAQGMDFDPATNTLYAAIYTGGGTGSYGTWNTATGVFTQVLDLPSFPDPSGNGRELEMAIRVPEPTSMISLMAGLLACVACRRRS